MFFSISPFKRIDRYIVQEILTPFWISLGVFTSILFLIRSLKLVDLVVNKSVPVGDMLYLFSLLIPRFLEVAIPMALLVSVVVAFGRLSADSELVVLRSVGLGFRRMGLAVLIIALVCAFASLAIGLWLRPWANYELSLGVFNITKIKASSSLVQGIFNDLGQLTIYAEKVSDEGQSLEHVIISDERDPNSQKVFVARHGQLVTDDLARTINFRLYDGSIEMGSGSNYSVTYFDINNITLGESDLVSGADARGKKSEEMFIGELGSAISEAKKIVNQNPSTDNVKSLRSLLIELSSRLALPFACLCVAFTSMALGVQPSRGGHSWGLIANVLAGIAIIIVYYLFTAIVKVWAEKVAGPVAPIIWLPNISFAVVSFYLFQRLGSERWLALSESFGNCCWRFFSFLRLSSRQIEEQQ